MNWVNPLVPPRAALLCIHGLGLNSDAYTNFGKHMARLGIQTYAIDMRGFGSWLKAQGHERLDFNGSLRDIKKALEAIRAANPGLPVFLLGESMGGAIALRACSLYPQQIDGLIASVPAGDRFQQKRTDLDVAVHFLEGPHKQFDIGTKIVDQATKSDRLRQAWESDPLNRMDLSAKDLMQFQSFMNENKEAAKKIEITPVLMVQGTLDKLVKPEGTWDLFEELPSQQKTFVALPSEHLVFEEGQVKSSRYDRRAARLVANWIYSTINPDSNIDEPNQGINTQSHATSLKAPGAASDITADAATVLVFWASWCTECQSLDKIISQAQQLFGDAFIVKKIDVDDSANTSLVKRFGVGPIPTCVFLEPNGSVNSTMIGLSNFANFAHNLRGIIR
jgi:alpha-beta hydrolase superfamily lysophospholipase